MCAVCALVLCERKGGGKDLILVRFYGGYLAKDLDQRIFIQKWKYASLRIKFFPLTFPR